MLFFDGGLGLVFLALWIFCIIDVITTPEGQCRNLPKLMWLLLVLLLVDVGSIAWLIAGRQWNRAGAGVLTYKGNPGSKQREYDRSGSRVATNPDDDEEFLAGLRARAEEQRRRAREVKPQDDDPGDRA